MVLLMLSARRTGLTTTVVTDRVNGIHVLKRPHPQAVILVEGGSKKVEERRMLRQVLLLFETPSGQQPFVLSGRS